ncbi:protein RD3-like [Oryzias latipes]|uniref:Uncharacterized protein n=1 Tax=Oryzias latipes TaxID=8090 RepID=A0A3B3IK56_ORYLA|nr:protein RD3-like [Oryzias latipes]
MPLFSWMKWMLETKAQAPDETSLNRSSFASSRWLIAQVLWHVEDRERWEEGQEGGHRQSHNASGLQWLQRYPRPQGLISSSELQQLEFLCAQIPPKHAATILSRFREMLATNSMRPWDLVSIFKQVLLDFLAQRECGDAASVQPAQLGPIETWTSWYKKEQIYVTPTVCKYGNHYREEIPTISGYVEWAMRQSSSNTFKMDWDLPCYYQRSLSPEKEYSTSL